MAKAAKNQRVRIIGGQWRRRMIDVAALDGLRPTPDRVRETVFNWLQPRIEGARVLDAFAGTGALAFEALSRGAARAVLLEQQPAAIAAMQVAAKMLAGPDDKCTEIVRADAYHWLDRQQATPPFDLVFLDPPFADDRMGHLCTLLVARGWLRDGARVYLEQPVGRAMQPEGLAMEKQQQAGQVVFGLYRLTS
ncbi:MAG: 16S rRNA (guanine(966)-N(2))-methyltransferase RsmD [Pseudomonadota bacterium]